MTTRIALECNTCQVSLYTEIDELADAIKVASDWADAHTQHSRS